MQRCRAHCPPTATPMMLFSPTSRVARKPCPTDTWHCFCFFTCEVRALHKYSGKEALLSLPSALGILGMALERAEGIIREIGEASSSIQPCSRGRRDMRQNAPIPTFMSLPLQRATAGPGNGTTVFPPISFPSQIPLP